MYPSSLKNLIESFKLLPGIGEKTAERLAFSILELDIENCELFSNSLIEVKKNIKKCCVCNALTENELCYICNDKNRNCDVLCVIDDPKSLFLFEKIGLFNGYYHIIDNLISPLDGINPEDIGIEKLLKRLQTGNFKELILALKPCLEGETTSLYIKKILEGIDIKVTKLASGIPMGTDMEYIDSMTLERAIIDRKEIE